MKPVAWCAVLLNVVLLFTQCQYLPVTDDPDTVVARVNRSLLTVDEMEAEMEAAALPAATLQMRKDWVSDWIRTELLYQEALRRDLDSKDETVRELNRIRRDHLANIVLEHLQLDSLLVVTDDEVIEYYEIHQQEFIYHEPELRLSVIVLPDEATARQIQTQLARRGGTFEELARSRSIHPSSVNGGDLGYLKKADISDVSVQELVFNMYVGQVSRPVLSESGSFIFRVMDRREVGTLPPLDEVRGEIVNRMLQERRRDAVRRFVETLQLGADVEIYDGALLQSEPMEP